MRPDIIELTPNKPYRLDGYEGYVLSASSAVAFNLVIEGQVQSNLEILPLVGEWLYLGALTASGFVKRRTLAPFLQVRFTSGTARVMLQKYVNFEDAELGGEQIIVASMVTMNPTANAGVPINSVFVDLSDGLLKFRNAAGVLKIVTVV